MHFLLAFDCPIQLHSNMQFGNWLLAILFESPCYSQFKRKLSNLKKLPNFISLPKYVTMKISKNWYTIEAT